MSNTERKPLRLAYLDPKKGLAEFVKDGQGMRMYGLSGQALLRAITERQAIQNRTEPVSSAEKRRKEKYGANYLGQEVTLSDGTTTTRAQRLLQRVDKYSSHAIPKSYEKVSQEQADDFYKRRMLDANNFVKEYTDLLFPSVQDIVGLNNDARLISHKRSAILELLQQNPIDEHLLFEAQRHLVLSNIAAELSERSRLYNINEQVISVQRELTSQLFKQPFGSTEYADTYALYDTKTNYVQEVFDSLPKSTQEGKFVRHLQKRMRVIAKDKLGTDKDQLVLCDVRTKPRTSEIIKVLRKAHNRRDASKGDGLNVTSDVQDTMGLQFVVKKTMDSFEDQVNKTVKAVREVVQNRWPHARFRENHETNGDGTSSPDQRYQRYKVYLDENAVLPFEMIFYGEGDYLNSIGSVGIKKDVYSNGTGPTTTYTGRAHELYKAKQASAILNDVMPSSVPFYNKRLNLRQSINSRLDEIATALQDKTAKEKVL